MIHIDMGAFYASVEQRDDPALRGRPVAVGHGAKPGVVAAASYEARAFGVDRRCRQRRRCGAAALRGLVFVPPRFEVYRAVSRQFHGIFARYTALIEPRSLDGAISTLPRISSGFSPLRQRRSGSARASSRELVSRRGRRLL